MPPVGSPAPSRTRPPCRASRAWCRNRSDLHGTAGRARQGRADCGFASTSRRQSRRGAGSHRECVPLRASGPASLPRRRDARRRRPIQPRQTSRFFEQRAVRQARWHSGQVDRPGAFAGRMIVTPACARATQVDDARAFLPRRSAGQIGTAKRFRSGDRRACGNSCGSQSAAVAASRSRTSSRSMRDRRLPDIVEVDHARMTRPCSARVITVYSQRRRSSRCGQGHRPRRSRSPIASPGTCAP